MRFFSYDIEKCKSDNMIKNGIPQTVSYSEQGVLVQYIQLALQRAGYELDIDGIYGGRTAGALAEFLKSKGWQIDDSEVGTVDEEVWKELLPYLKGYTWHTVEDGDTFWGIARMYQTTVDAIQTANPGIFSGQLQVGSMLVVPLDFTLVSEQVVYTSLLTCYILEGMKFRYPFVQLSSIGQSVMGKDLWCLRVGSGDIEVSYNASFHANEWITTPVLLKFAEEYAKAYTAGGLLYEKRAAELFWNYSLYIVPMVNPDGVDLVNRALSEMSGLPKEEAQFFEMQARRIAEQFPGIPFPDGWKANIDGVDLNLQYPAGWRIAREQKYAQGFTKPAPRDFVGTAPLSAPESRAMYELTKSHDFELILAYHTQGEVIYWRYLDYEPEQAAEIGAYFQAVSGYLLEETPTYSGYAGYKDWFIKTYVRPGFTIEAGKGVNPLSMEQFPSIYQKNRLILEGGMSQLHASSN